MSASAPSGDKDSTFIVFKKDKVLVAKKYLHKNAKATRGDAQFYHITGKAGATDAAATGAPVSDDV